MSNALEEETSINQLMSREDEKEKEKERRHSYNIFQNKSPTAVLIENANWSSLSYCKNVLLSKLPHYLIAISNLKFSEAANLMTPFPLSKTKFSVLDNIDSPFLLFSTCEAIYFEFSFIEASSINGNSLGDMYFQVLYDFDILLKCFSQFNDYQPNLFPSQSSARGEDFDLISTLPLKSRELNRFNAKKNSRKVEKAPLISPNSYFNAVWQWNDCPLCILLERLCTIIGIRLTMIDVFVQIRNSYSSVDEMIAALESVQLETASLATCPYLERLARNIYMEAYCLSNMLSCRSRILSGNYEMTVISCQKLLASLDDWYDFLTQSNIDTTHEGSVIGFNTANGVASLHWIKRCCVRLIRVFAVLYSERRALLMTTIGLDTILNVEESGKEGVREGELPVNMYQQPLLKRSGTLKLSIDKLISSAGVYFTHLCLQIIQLRNSSFSSNRVTHYQCPPRTLWKFSGLKQDYATNDDGKYRTITVMSVLKADAIIPVRQDLNTANVSNPIDFNDAISETKDYEQLPPPLPSDWINDHLKHIEELINKSTPDEQIEPQEILLQNGVLEGYYFLRQLGRVKEQITQNDFQTADGIVYLSFTALGTHGSQTIDRRIMETTISSAVQKVTTVILAEDLFEIVGKSLQQTVN